jgi:hypothetical protein
MIPLVRSCLFVGSSPPSDLLKEGCDQAIKLLALAEIGGIKGMRDNLNARAFDRLDERLHVFNEQWLMITHHAKAWATDTRQLRGIMNPVDGIAVTLGITWGFYSLPPSCFFRFFSGILCS